MPSRSTTSDDGAFPSALERALADVLGGLDGGWAFWSAGLAAIELAIARSREREAAFSSYPDGELGRFLRDLEDALSLASIGVELQTLLNGDAVDGRGDHRRALIVDVLEARVRELRARREPL